MRIAALALVLLLLGCGGASPQRTLYLFRTELVERTGRVEPPHRIGLGRVVVAPYLDQTGLVVEIAKGQVHAARTHRWAEPLQDALRSYLRAEISSALGFEVGIGRMERLPWEYTIDVYIDQLHGTMGGRALIEAGYRITPEIGLGEVSEFRFSSTAPLPREGYAGLFEAEVDLASQLAHAIAKDLAVATERTPDP